MGKQFLKKKTIKSFQNNISDLIDSLGREVLVYVGSGIPNANWDPVNNEPIDGSEEVIYDDDIFTVEKAIVDWDAAQSYEYLAGGRVAPGDVRIRCRIEDVLMSGSDFNNSTIFEYARKVIIDGQTMKTVGTPVKSGLRDLYIVDVWLTRVVE